MITTYTDTDTTAITAFILFEDYDPLQLGPIDIPGGTKYIHHRYFQLVCYVTIYCLSGYNNCTDNE